MPFDFRSVMSGQRRDPLALAMRGGLRLASLGYGIGVASRNRSFDRGNQEVHRCGVPVISVGNLTTGGTGKTPIVCFLAKALRAKGLRVAIVSRGYGRRDGDANDEAMELHDRLPDVPHLQDPDRVEAARIAVEELETQVILMDDGFQHRRLHRDLDLVVVDAMCPFGYDYLIPRGLLREPIRSLSRADLVIISRCDVVGEHEIDRIEKLIRGVQPSLPLVRSSHTPTTLLTYPSDQRSSEQLRGQDVLLLSAIGNPQAFERTVIGCGANVIDTKSLPDHDPFSPETVSHVIEWAKSLRHRAARVICTHKDLVKLRSDRLGGLPLEALIIDLTITSGSVALEDCITSIAEQAARLPASDF